MTERERPERTADDEELRDPLLREAALLLRAPAALDPALPARVVAGARTRRREGGRLSLSPWAALAAGLACVALGAGSAWTLARRGDPAPGAGAATVAAPAGVAGDAARVVRFVLVAPGASRVSLVGDFNGWDPRATPMIAEQNGVIWTATVPLAAGRHVYAFVLDDRDWVADPSAPLAPEDGFGAPSSVVVVEGAS